MLSMLMLLWQLCAACCVLLAVPALSSKLYYRDIRMPGIRPYKEDNYMCVSSPIVGNDEQYIVQYEALAVASIAHHMILMHCDEPMNTTDPWMCVRDTCKYGAQRLLFAWAKNAKPLHMPNDVGFQIGKKAYGGYFVLQIHYKMPSKPEDPADTSGLRITLTRDKQKYLASIGLLVSNDAIIPPRTPTVHVDLSCQYAQSTVMYPFAFRVHAHTLGVVVSGYLYNGTWTEIGKSNPAWPQAFYETDKKIVVHTGDTLASRCTFDSTSRDGPTKMGSTHTDEMCNFYIMYYTLRTDGEKPKFWCTGNHRRGAIGEFPADSDKPMPRNPDLEAIADGQAPSAIKVVSNWPHIKASDNIQLNYISGVDTDSRGRLLVFHRGDRAWDAGHQLFDLSNKFLPDNGPIAVNTLVWFHSNGSVLDQWGRDLFYLPHGLHIDINDDIWVTDIGAHQVLKFSGVTHKLLATYGVKLEPGSDEKHFCKPTGVTTLFSGEFFVSDGYCNNRIMKFSKDGMLLKEWGTASYGLMEDNFPSPSTFDLPHAITVIDVLQQVCVADRMNGRIQCFSLDGEFVRQIHPDEFQGTIYDVDYGSKSGVLFAINGIGAGSTGKSLALSGFALDPLAGTLLQTWHPVSKAFTNPHCVTVSKAGDYLYVGEMTANGLWQFRVNLNILADSHQSVKKAGVNVHTIGTSVKKAGVDTHPASLGDDDNDEFAEAALESELRAGHETDLGASLVIGALLVIPVLIIISVTVYVRLRRKGKSLLVTHANGSQRRFNLGSILNRHHGFKRLDTTDASDNELDPLNSDSELDEYSAKPMTRAI